MADTSSPNVVPKPKLIAFYLPQFHPIPENDEWWGKGFTEWTNVTKAQPLFEGHYQPHLPTDMGFYDLRVRKTRHDQIELAKQYGIDGFCYHYYWFSGTRLLNQPLEDMLADRGSNMPFCLCWANENWTRKWDAAEKEVLIAQKYLPEDDLNFIKGVASFFKDPRYIRLNGKPFLIVYRAQHLPDAKKTANIWREHCRSVGIGEIHLCAALTHGNEDYAQFGFDSGVEFPPHNLHCNNVANSILFHQPFRGRVVQYEEVAQTYMKRRYKNGNVFKTVFPAWDNTPRTGNRAVIVLNGTPKNYEYWLSKTIDNTQKQFPAEERLVFINAWNEWAEGCHLEPDRKYGLQYLEATLRATLKKSQVESFSSYNGLSISEPKRTLMGDLYCVMVYHLSMLAGQLAVWLKKYPRLRACVRWVMGRGAV